MNDRVKVVKVAKVARVKVFQVFQNIHGSQLLSDIQTFFSLAVPLLIDYPGKVFAVFEEDD